MSCLILNNSKDRDPKDSLDNLTLCLTNLMFNQKPTSYIKNFCIFMCFKQCQLPPVLSLQTVYIWKEFGFSSLLLGRCRQKIDLSENLSSSGLGDSTSPACTHMAWSLLCGLGNLKLGTAFHTCQCVKDHFLHFWLGRGKSQHSPGCPWPPLLQGHISDTCLIYPPGLPRSLPLKLIS